MPVLDQDRSLSIRETADLLSVSPDIVRTPLRRGEITAVRVGHQFRIGTDVLRLYISTNQVPA